MIRWLVIGIGDITRRRVIPAILAEPRSRLQAVLTRDPEKAAAYPGVRVFTTIEDALAARGRSPSCVRARLQSCRKRVKMNRPLGPWARAKWSQHSSFQPDRFPPGLKPTIHWTASTARLKSCPDTLAFSMRLSPRAVS